MALHCHNGDIGRQKRTFLFNNFCVQSRKLDPRDGKASVNTATKTDASQILKEWNEGNKDAPARLVRWSTENCAAWARRTYETSARRRASFLRSTGCNRLRHGRRLLPLWRDSHSRFRRLRRTHDPVQRGGSKAVKMQRSNCNAILFAGFGRGETGLCPKHQVGLVWPTPAPEICSVKHWRHHNEENKGHRRLLRTDCGARILHIGICWSERKRGSAGNTTASNKNRKENAHRYGVGLPYPQPCNRPAAIPVMIGASINFSFLLELV